MIKESRWKLEIVLYPTSLILWPVSNDLLFKYLKWIIHSKHFFTAYLCITKQWFLFFLFWILYKWNQFYSSVFLLLSSWESTMLLYVAVMHSFSLSYSVPLYQYNSLQILCWWTRNKIGCFQFWAIANSNVWLFFYMSPGTYSWFLPRIRIAGV